MSLSKLIAKALKDAGYDGLCNFEDDWEGCSCDLNDLIPCDSERFNINNCEPGYKIPCPGDCEWREEYLHHHWHMVLKKPEVRDAV